MRGTTRILLRPQAHPATVARKRRSRVGNRVGEKLEEDFWGRGGGTHSCFGQLRAACPPWRCLSSPFAFHTAAESAWCCESREKNRQEDGGLRAGNREHESSWETRRGLAARGGPRAGDGQQLRLGRGRGGGRGPQPPSAPHIPGGNSIFGGSRAPGRNSWAAFGARPQPGRWDSEPPPPPPPGFPRGGGDFGGQRGDTQTCQALRWGPPGLVGWVQPQFGAQAPLNWYTGGRVWARGASVSPPWSPPVPAAPSPCPTGSKISPAGHLPWVTVSLPLSPLLLWGHSSPGAGRCTPCPR